MDKKSKIVTVLIVISCMSVFFLNRLEKKNLEEKAESYYQIYLNGEKIGAVLEEDTLYDMIDKNHGKIKEEYHVDRVYAPTSLKVVKTEAFLVNKEDLESENNLNTIYKKLKDNDEFSIKGYVVTISTEDETYSINVLDKNVFYNAAKRFVKAFLDENEYENYIQNTQKEVEDLGHKIEDMYFKEKIVIKEAYISVHDKIYTDELELSQFLLFGSDPDTKSYTVKLGDTVESISEANKLNTEELLIANPNLKSVDTLLRVGEELNVTLIKPKLTFIYSIYEVSNEITYFTKKTVYDSSKAYGTKEVTTPGQNGVTKVTGKYLVTNGEREQGIEPIKVEEIRKAVDQVTTIGTRYDGPIYQNPNPVQISGDWGWPTNSGYVITSYWGWRWGSLHKGIDISGAGNFGSNIYAVADGVVIYTFNGCPSRGNGYGDPCGGELGNQIIIDHQNGYYTSYGHMHQSIPVSVGQTVKKGQIIGYMGNSGSSTGSHVHFAVGQGSVKNYFNPLLLYN